MMVSAAEETSNLESDNPVENPRKRKRNFTSKSGSQDNSGDESDNTITKKSRLPLPPAVSSIYQNVEICQSPDIIQLNRMIDNNASCQGLLSNKETFSSIDLTPTRKFYTVIFF